MVPSTYAGITWASPLTTDTSKRRLLAIVAPVHPLLPLGLYVFLVGIRWPMECTYIGSAAGSAEPARQGDDLACRSGLSTWCGAAANIPGW